MFKQRLLSASFVLLVLNAVAVRAQFLEAPSPPPPPLGDLDLPIVVEKISGLPLIDASSTGAGGFIKDEAAAIRLGKALFWDQQAGSDGMACASCHFKAGADGRIKNALSPGLKGGNAVFDTNGSGGKGPNHTLVAADFPFHRKADPADRDSAVEFDTDDVASSQGTFARNFVDIVLGEAVDDCTVIPADPVGFQINNVNLRRVEPRNTPTVINAVFNDRNFWDGRANNSFNGVNPFGRRDVDARILEVQGGSVMPIGVDFENSSLASQAVGPFLSDFEMSCAGRTFPKLGKKMLSLPPLGQQQVHPNDSVLGPWAAAGTGLTTSYLSMIQSAFADRFWDSNKLFDGDKNEIGAGAPANTNQFTLAEINFSFFAGLAIQHYERTLVSGNAPIDQFAAGDDNALTPQQLVGLDLFFTNTIGQRGLCSTCHQGPTFTTAGFPFTIEEESGEFPETEERVERMRIGDGVTVIENLLKYFIRGEGTVGGTTLSGTAGSREVPTKYPAGVGGHIYLNGVEHKVCSFMVAQDGDVNTRDVVFHITPIGTLCPEVPAANPPNPDPVIVTLIENSMSGVTDFLSIDDDGTVTSGFLAAGDFVFEGPTLYDTAIYNIGIRPTAEDPGIDANDPWGNPLSITKQWIAKRILGQPAADDFLVNPANFHNPFNWFGDGVFYPAGLAGPEWPEAALFFPPDVVAGFVEGRGQEAVPKNDPANLDAINAMPTAVGGAFKVPGLRNVSLTGPYMHNGGMRTLREVIEFYNRGGDFALENLDDLTPNIHPLHLNDMQIDALVAFMDAFTDEDVACERGPYDHPALKVPDGYKASRRSGRLRQYPNRADPDSLQLPPGLALDDFRHVPAIGAGGLPDENLPCLKGFLE